VRSLRRFARRALAFAGREPWLAFLIKRCGLAMSVNQNSKQCVHTGDKHRRMKSMMPLHPVEISSAAPLPDARLALPTNRSRIRVGTRHTFRAKLELDVPVGRRSRMRIVNTPQVPTLRHPFDEMIVSQDERMVKAAADGWRRCRTGLGLPMGGPIADVTQ
jgi:hypothetical protein